MAFFERIEKKETLYRHGGREVLRVCVDVPVGESAVATHMRAIGELLAAYAAREILPVVKETLDAAMRAGEGYAFSPQRYVVRIEVVKRCVTVYATHTCGAQLLSERVLQTHWTQSGAWQTKRHHRVR
jgi:hypothetical protein